MDTASDLGFDFNPVLPVPISSVYGRYLLFDIKIATWLRREHRICGTTLGTLPIAPSQNMFLGVPIEIMPEEAQLLVERGIAVIVDDAREHELAVKSADRARRMDYLARIEKQSKRVSQAKDQEKLESKKRALHRLSKKSTNSGRINQPDTTADLLDCDDGEGAQADQEGPPPISEGKPDTEELPVKALSLTSNSHAYQVTPATSRLLLSPSSTASKSSIENLSASYPLYRHLHDKGFFMSPGLRFGCQYTVYPGDPLRFHSHFLAVGTQWDEEIDLMDIVGGGRLGTGVKKGFLLGGANPDGDVRTFSVEWAAM